MKKILFDAHTPYQLMVASFVSYIYYPNDFTTLLLGSTSFSNVDNLKKNLIDSALFSRVEITYEHKNKEILIEQLKHFELDNTDIFHISSYATISSCCLFNRLCKDTKIILNEEGLATYALFEKYIEFKKLFPSKIRDDIDLKKLCEIWVFNKKLYSSKFKNRVKEINLCNIEDEPLLIEKLNRIFEYTFSKINEKSIFFTQNFLDYGVVTEAEMEEFYRNMNHQLDGELVLKLHPSDKNIRMYKKLNIKILHNIDNVPWELVLLNHIIRDSLESKIFLTVGSTSLSAFNLLLKYKNIEDKHKYILMTRLLNTPFNDTTEQQYQKISNLTNLHYYLPESFDCLKS